LTLSCDVSQWEQVDAAVRTAEAENGPVDVLLSCAGYCYPVEFVDMPLEHIDGQVGTNLLGTIYVARAVAPGMVARGRGHIAMVASMGGFIGVYGYGAYAPSKFGVMGFAEVLRSELKPCGIGVSVLCPPNVDSPGYAREVAMEPAETAKINAGTKMVSPASMAEVLLGAVDRNRFLVVPGFMNGLYYRLKGILPEIFYLVFDGDIAAARSREVRPDAE
jgi:3-dehydrosphinganine reductase